MYFANLRISSVYKLTVIKLYIPAGNIFRCIASLLFLVINGPIATTLFSWCYSVQTDIKLLTIIWMSKFRMIDDHSSRVHLTFSWTFETIFQFFVYYSASLSKKKSNLMRVYRLCFVPLIFVFIQLLTISDYCCK